MSAGYCTSFQTVYEPEIGYKKLIPAVEEGGGGGDTPYSGLYGLALCERGISEYRDFTS